MKLKSFLIETDAWLFLLAFVISLVITIAELSQLQGLILSVKDATRDNAGWLVILSLLICPGYVIGVPFYLIYKYKKWHSS